MREGKTFLALHELHGVCGSSPHMVEVGPASAVAYLASELASRERRADGIRLALVEVPGVVSESLQQAMDAFHRVGGTCQLVTGFAQDVAS